MDIKQTHIAKFHIKVLNNRSETEKELQYFSNFNDMDFANCKKS